MSQQLFWENVVCLGPEGPFPSRWQRIRDSFQACEGADTATERQAESCHQGRKQPLALDPTLCSDRVETVASRGACAPSPTDRGCSGDTSGLWADCSPELQEVAQRQEWPETEAPPGEGTFVGVHSSVGVAGILLVRENLGCCPW